MNFSGLCMMDRSPVRSPSEKCQGNIQVEYRNSCERSRGTVVPPRPLDVKEKKAGKENEVYIPQSDRTTGVSEGC